MYISYRLLLKQSRFGLTPQRCESSFSRVVPPRAKEPASKERFLGIFNQKRSTPPKSEQKSQYVQDRQQRDPQTRQNNRPRANFDQLLRKSTVPSYQFSGGTEKARDAMKWIVDTVLKENEMGKLIIVTKSGLQNSSFEKLQHDLNLDEQGVSIVNWKRLDRDNKPVASDANEDLVVDKVPMVKMVPINELIKRHSEHLSEKRAKAVENMTQRGSFVQMMKDKAERKKQAIKYVKLSWSISLSDFNNQKRKAIMDKLEKGQRLMIIIDDKRRISRLGYNGAMNEATKHKDETEEEDDDEDTPPPTSRFPIREISKNEERRREKLLDEIKLMVNEYAVSSAIEGVIADRMSIIVSDFKIKPKEDTTPTKKDSKTSGEPTLSPKDLKKQERREKQRLREEQKKAEAEAKRKLFEEMAQ